MALGWSSFGVYLSNEDLGGGGFVTPNGVDGGLYQGDFTFESLGSMSGGAPVHWATSTFDGLYLIDGSEGFMNTYVFIDTGNPVSSLDQYKADTR